MGLSSYEKWLIKGGAKNQPPTTYEKWKSQQGTQKASNDIWRQGKGGSASA